MFRPNPFLYLLDDGSGGSGGGSVYDYEIENAALLNGSTDYFSRTPSSSGNLKTWSFGALFRRCELGQYHHLIQVYTAGSEYFQIRVENDDTINVRLNTSSGAKLTLVTELALRDTNSWYHLLFTLDTSLATPEYHLYINEEEITDFSTETNNLTQDMEFVVNKAGEAHALFSQPDGSYSLNGYAAQAFIVDGEALLPAEVGQFSSVIPTLWTAKDISGLTFGTNGFLLDFSNALDLGEDVSGQGNDFTVNGSPKQTGDTPTNNSVVWNALAPSGPTLSNGNLTMTASEAHGTFALISGKWAWKFDATSVAAVGVEEEDGTESTVNSAIGSTDEFFLDADAGALSYKRDGGSLTSIATGLTGPYFILSKAAGTLQVEDFTPSESGYSLVQSENFPEPDVLDTSDYYYQEVFTAPATASKDITLPFNAESNDWLMILKNMDSAESWVWVNTKTGLDKYLRSDTVNSLASLSTAITRSGSVVTLPDDLLADGDEYLVQFMRDDGDHFTITEYVGTGVAKTVSHGGSSTPFMNINKNLGVGRTWRVQHEGVGPTKNGRLDDTAAFATSSTVWNDTAPTSSVVSIGTDASVNENGEDFIMFCWFDSGVYKAIDYTGNADADGPFCYLGGRPQAIPMLKNSGIVNNWFGFFSSIFPFNPQKHLLCPNEDVVASSPAEMLDFISNGIKLRTTNNLNASGNQLVGLAVLDQPLKYTNAR